MSSSRFIASMNRSLRSLLTRETRPTGQVRVAPCPLLGHRLERSAFVVVEDRFVCVQVKNSRGAYPAVAAIPVVPLFGRPAWTVFSSTLGGREASRHPRSREHRRLTAIPRRDVHPLRASSASPHLTCRQPSPAIVESITPRGTESVSEATGDRHSQVRELHDAVEPWRSGRPLSVGPEHRDETDSSGAAGRQVGRRAAPRRRARAARRGTSAGRVRRSRTAARPKAGSDDGMRQSERAADDHQLEATHTTSTRPTPARGWASGPLIDPSRDRISSVRGLTVPLRGAPSARGAGCRRRDGAALSCSAAGWPGSGVRARNRASDRLSFLTIVTL